MVEECGVRVNVRVMVNVRLRANVRVRVEEERSSVGIYRVDVSRGIHGDTCTRAQIHVPCASHRPGIRTPP